LAALEARAITQRAFADLLHITESAVSRWMDGETEPPPTRRRFMEEILQLPNGWLDLDGKVKPSDVPSTGVYAPRPMRTRTRVSEGIDRDATPQPISEPRTLSEVALHVGNAVARAIQRTIDKNELWYRNKGRLDLIASLHTLAREFTDRGIDATDIDEAIAWLRRDSK
jgi:transcriptional regulator with XRE-family HTH domain